jgi:hypothetical protein
LLFQPLVKTTCLLGYMSQCGKSPHSMNVHLQEKECVAQPRVVGEPRRVDWLHRLG